MWGTRCFKDESLSWETEEMTLADLRLNNTDLPLLVKVTEGYLGVTDSMTFSSDQMLLLHCWGEQERVLGRKRGGPSLSIPLDIDHPLKVALPVPGGGEPHIEIHSMREIVTDFQPPVLGRFVTDRVTEFYVNGLPCDTVGLRWIHLVSSHYLHYVIASSVNEGKVDPEHHHYIPISRRLRFTVVKQIGKYSQRKTRRLLEMYYDDRKHSTNLTAALSSLGIAGYSDISWGDEENVQIYKMAPWGNVFTASNAYKETFLKANTHFTRPPLDIGQDPAEGKMRGQRGRLATLQGIPESEPSIETHTVIIHTDPESQHEAEIKAADLPKTGSASSEDSSVSMVSFSSSVSTEQDVIPPQLGTGSSSYLSMEDLHYNLQFLNIPSDPETPPERLSEIIRSVNSPPKDDGYVIADDISQFLPKESHSNPQADDNHLTASHGDPDLPPPFALDNTEEKIEENISPTESIPGSLQAEESHSEMVKEEGSDSRPDETTSGDGETNIARKRVEHRTLTGCYSSPTPVEGALPDLLQTANHLFQEDATHF